VELMTVMTIMTAILLFFLKRENSKQQFALKILKARWPYASKSTCFHFVCCFVNLPYNFPTKGKNGFPSLPCVVLQREKKFTPH
jgi:hypothetical protein